MSGLREAKKLRTKRHIQQTALRLFASEGYAKTTVDEIAKQSEVSPSTFFRYFETKESIVMYDSLDPIIIEAFRNQPANLDIIPALRGAIRQSFASLEPSQYEQEMQRFALIRTIPELRARVLDEMARSIDLFAALIAHRSKKDPTDLRVRNLAGAIIGAGIAALIADSGRPKRLDSIAAFDAALEELERGLSL